MPDRKPLAERFWPRVDRSAGPDQCWPWTGCIDRATGYGRIGRPGHQGEGKSPFFTHRVACALSNGLDPALLKGVLRHLCHNRICCNPSYLRLGSQAQNLHEAAVRGTAHWTKGLRDQRGRFRRAAA